MPTPSDQDVPYNNREQFWKQMHEGFGRIRRDPEAWKRYKDEVALWDSTLEDGLKNEEPYYLPDGEAQIIVEIKGY